MRNGAPRRRRGAAALCRLTAIRNFAPRGFMGRGEPITLGGPNLDTGGGSTPLSRALRVLPGAVGGRKAAVELCSALRRLSP